MFGLHHACYQLRICHRPPRQARRPAATIEELLTADVQQPEIRQVALRYLALMAATLRPGTLALRADSLIVFCEYHAAAHPEVRRLPQLTRAHLEGFQSYNHRRPWRGRVARDQPVARVGLQTDRGRPTRILRRPRHLGMGRTTNGPATAPRWTSPGWIGLFPARSPPI